MADADMEGGGPTNSALMEMLGGEPMPAQEAGEVMY
jgi:hypothetical protein